MQLKTVTWSRDNGCFSWHSKTGPLRPIVDSSLPDVRKAVWALITRPPHLVVAIRLDDYVAKVHVLLLMPLCLQLFCKHADGGSNFFASNSCCQLSLRLLTSEAVSAK